MILTPLELSLGEPFEDVAVNPVGTSASSAKKAWDDATASLTRDPAVALAPLRFLAANRFGIPDPWPVESPRVLLEALAVANATAASSPSLASDLWSLAAVLLGTWARWRSERHPGGTSEAREILLSIARTVREHATRAHDNARRKLPNSPFVASQLGATPLLTLACVASAPLCPRETKAGALRDVARVAALAVDADFGATTTTSLLRPESSAQRLVAAFTYAVSAADDDDDARWRRRRTAVRVGVPRVEGLPRRFQRVFDFVPGGRRGAADVGAVADARDAGDGRELPGMRRRVTRAVRARDVERTGGGRWG